jgi:hypothetical protein
MCSLLCCKLSGISKLNKKDMCSLLCCNNLKNLKNYFFEYSREREKWILVCKLLRIALPSCCIYRGWSNEAHLKLYMNIQLWSVYEKQPMCSCFCCLMHKCCKKCVIPSEECSEEHSLLSSLCRQPTWGCNTAVHEL